MDEKEIYEKWRAEYEASFPHRGPVTFGQKHMWKHGFNAYRNALNTMEAANTSANTAKPPSAN
jgi:hypothetical protein